MKKSDFMKSVQVGGCFAGKNKLVNILNYVKVKIKDGRLSVVSSDGDSFVRHDVSMDFPDDSDCAFCFEPSKVMSFLKNIGGEYFYLSIDEKGSKMTISHDNGDFVLPLGDLSVFPTSKMESDAKSVELSASVLRNWISTGMDFVAVNDSLRPQMSGVFLYKEGGELGCCASDCVTLYSDNMLPPDDACDDFKLTIPYKVLKPFVDCFATAETIRMYISERKMMFKSDDTMLSCPIVEGRYPNFKSVIGSGRGELDFTAAKSDIREALNRCVIAADDNTSLVVVTVNNNDMEFTAKDDALSTDAHETVKASSYGNITVGMKIPNIQRVLKHISTEKVNMSWSPMKPCFFREEDNNNVIFLLMPMCLPEP